ncbi:MAG: hypothetical protein LBB53_00170 [Prevotellaceae bacterium]|jgi:hypothetical protein|nr:hypothetical protein [Prevotellaceae bacterium]
MKKLITFAVFLTKTILTVMVCVAFFIAANTALYAAENRLSNSNGCCALKPVIVFVKMKGDSLSYLLNFSFMTKTMKDYSMEKNSNLTVTPTERNTVSIHEKETNCTTVQACYTFTGSLSDVFKTVFEIYSETGILPETFIYQKHCCKFDEQSARKTANGTLSNKEYFEKNFLY